MSSARMRTVCPICVNSKLCVARQKVCGVRVCVYVNVCVDVYGGRTYAHVHTHIQSHVRIYTSYGTSDVHSCGIWSLLNVFAKLLRIVCIYHIRLTMAHLFTDHTLFMTFQQAYNSNASASENDTRIVTNYDIMMDTMKRAGLLQHLQLPPHIVGVHPANRGGKTMSGLSMMAKGAKILMVGASRKLCGSERCIAMEDPPGTSTTYNRMVETAKGCSMFAQPSHHIRYGSLGFGHLNQFLTSVNARRPTSEAFLWEHMGAHIVDKARLCASDPVLDDLCHNGLTWTIIPHSIGSAFPLLADMVQKALNVEHHIGEGETWDQVMHQIATEARCHSIRKQGAEHVDWAKVTKKVRQSLPSSAIDLQCGLVRGLPYMVNKSKHTQPAPTCPTKPTTIRQSHYIELSTPCPGHPIQTMCQ